MGKGAQVTRAVANSIEANKYVARYTGVDKRVYNTEPDGRKLNTRKSAINKLRYHENEIAISDIWRIEWFLAHDTNHDVQEQRRVECMQPSITSKDRQRIVSEYQLNYDVMKNKYHGDPDFIFSRMCEKYERAASYKKYKGLKYAVKYGDVACEVTRESANES